MTSPVSHLSEQLASKSISSHELVQQALAASSSDQDRLGDFLQLRNDQALKEAQESDARRARGDSHGPLDGIPIAVKDNMTMAGEVTTAASKMLEHYRAVETATALQKLQAAGAIIIGKTNLDEFAMGASTENSAFHSSKNPWDESVVPGGSSGGSAVAVASGHVPLALGSDTGGSIRQPAGFCNVVGMKPTYGRVSRSGLIALASSLDQIGPFARTVEDAATLYSVIAGHDDRDATSSTRTVDDVRSGMEDGVRGLRIGLPKEFFADGLDPQVAKVVHDARNVFQKAGAEIVEVSLPHAPQALATYYIILPAEASSNLARYDGVRYGLSVRDGAGLYDMYAKSRGQGLGAEVKRRIMIGTFVLSAGYSDAFYHQALRVRAALTEEFHQVFDQVDVLLTPTSPTMPFKFGARAADPLQMYLADLYTVPANLANIPAMSLPGGFVDGLPVGIQLMAKQWDEATMFRVGHAFQQLTDWHTKTPPNFRGA